MDAVKGKLLKALEKELGEFDDVEQTSLFDAKELDAPMDLLRVIHTEFGSRLMTVMGEYFFLPIEAEEVMYFSSVITLTNSLPKDCIEELGAAIARANYLLPLGNFSLGGEGYRTLVFKYTVPVMLEDKVSRRQTEVMTAADAALMIAERFSGYLMSVVEGSMNTEKMIRALAGE